MKPEPSPTTPPPDRERIDALEREVARLLNRVDALERKGRVEPKEYR